MSEKENNIFYIIIYVENKKNSYFKEFNNSSVKWISILTLF